MSMFTMTSIRSGDTVAKDGCYLCLTDQETEVGALVDLDMVIVGEGRLVLCAKCLAAASALLGYITPSQAMELQQAVDALRRQLTGLRMSEGRYRKANAALRELVSTEEARAGRQADAQARRASA